MSVQLTTEVNSEVLRHPAAIVESASIGPGTRVWAFAHILSGAVIGRDCNICDHTFIENDVILGDRVTLQCGVQLWDGLRLEDDVFVGPNVTFTSAAFPRGGQHPTSGQLRQTTVKKGACIGPNATILPGLTIGSRAMISAGAVVTGDVPADTIVAGNPARIVGYMGAKEHGPLVNMVSVAAGIQSTDVRGVTLHRLPSFHDMRGEVSVGEVQAHIPFPIQRYFLVYDVPSKEIRGEHAHKTLHQFLTCVHGSCHIVVDDGRTRREFKLDNPSLGVHIPPRVWCVQYRHSADAVLLVLASEPYNASDYIRDYSEFLAFLAS
jgi:UDP-2-acetamido-3-amino-2,3-dideoxy-glucuronate N-acetyltransferase